MTEIHLARLQKLADHLKHGELGHVRFWFGDYSVKLPTPLFKYDTVLVSEVPVGKCGYAGCAIGECPKVFPEDWRFVSNDVSPYMYPELKASRHDSFSVIDAGCEFFGLEEDEFTSLFIPGEFDCTEAQIPRFVPGLKLDRCASRSTVAKNLQAFIDIKRREVINPDWIKA